MRFEFILTHGEFARAWLAEYYLASKRGALRLLAGPALAFFGWKLHSLHRGTWIAIIGTCALGYGIYYALKPLVQVLLLVRRRHKLGAQSIATIVQIDDEGIHIRSGAASVSFAWDEIARASQRSDYVWFETARGTKGTIPLRSIDDRDELEQVLRDRGKWS